MPNFSLRNRAVCLSDISENDINNEANKDGYVSLEETRLNTPSHRGRAILHFQHLCTKTLFVIIAARLVQQYDFYSGKLIGPAAGEGN